MEGYSVLDMVVLLLVGGGAVFGLMRGLVQEVISLAAWFVGIIAVRLFQAPVTEWLIEPVGSRAPAYVLALGLLFLGGYGITRFLASRLGSTTRASFIGAFDRVLGAGFGMVKGLAAASLLFLLVTLRYDFLGTTRPAWITDSRSFPALNATSAAIVGLVNKVRASNQTTPKTPPQP